MNSKNTFKYHWEDFRVGDIRTMGSKVVSEEEILAFAHQFDPQRFHVDVAQAQQTIYKGLIASGWHTCGMVFKMVCDEFLLETSSMGSPGLENLRWLKPVRPGDTLHARLQVQDKRVMESKPDMGLVRMLWEGINQHQEVVVSMEGWGMYLKRPTS